MMGDLSDNFSSHEFACKCGCGFNQVDMRVVDYLQQIRDFFDARVTVTSGCRCQDHNRSVGGSPRSQHLLGTAADIKVRNVPPSVVHEYCDQIDVPGLGYYATFVHVDVRDGGARW